MKNDTIAMLKTALDEIEGGRELSFFTGGHGFQSRLFEFSWSDGQLEIDFKLPYAMVFASEEAQAEANADIAGAIRMAILLLMLPEDGPHISVEASSRGMSYSVSAPSGELEDSGDDWGALLKRLETALAPAGDEHLSIIWP